MKRSSDVVAKIGNVFASTFSSEGFSEDGERRLHTARGTESLDRSPEGTTSPAPLRDATDLLPEIGPL
jgi:hypothetical protein